MKIDPFLYVHASEKVRSNSEIALSAVKANGILFRYVPKDADNYYSLKRFYKY